MDPVENHGIDPCAAELSSLILAKKSPCAVRSTSFVILGKLLIRAIEIRNLLHSHRTYTSPMVGDQHHAQVSGHWCTKARNFNNNG